MNFVEVAIPKNPFLLEQVRVIRKCFNGAIAICRVDLSIIIIIMPL